MIHQRFNIELNPKNQIFFIFILKFSQFMMFLFTLNQIIKLTNLNHHLIRNQNYHFIFLLLQNYNFMPILSSFHYIIFLKINLRFRPSSLQKTHWIFLLSQRMNKIDLIFLKIFQLNPLTFHIFITQKINQIILYHVFTSFI